MHNPFHFLNFFTVSYIAKISRLLSDAALEEIMILYQLSLIGGHLEEECCKIACKKVLSGLGKYYRKLV